MCFVSDLQFLDLRTDPIAPLRGMEAGKSDYPHFQITGSLGLTGFRRHRGGREAISAPGCIFLRNEVGFFFPSVSAASLTRRLTTRRPGRAFDSCAFNGSAIYPPTVTEPFFGGWMDDFEMCCSGRATQRLLRDR